MISHHLVLQGVIDTDFLPDNISRMSYICYRNVASELGNTAISSIVDLQGRAELYEVTEI